jgi:hypothetical protein
MNMTREQKAEESIRLEILLTKMEAEGVAFNKCSQVLRALQKLRDSI